MRFYSRSPEAEAYRKLYANARWRKSRLRFLRDNPICVFCQRQGFITEAKIVDHITPHEGDPDLFWDEANWQALCKPCHDAIKAQMERGGYSSMADEDGYPIDPNHPQVRRSKGMALEASGRHPTAPSRG